MERPFARKHRFLHFKFSMTIPQPKPYICPIKEERKQTITFPYIHLRASKMTIKKVQSAIGIWYRILSSGICQFLYDVKPKAQLERCAPSVQLAIRCLIANYCTRGRCNFKGLSQDGGWADFSKNLRASLFNDDLSIEPNLGWTVPLKIFSRPQSTNTGL